MKTVNNKSYPGELIKARHTLKQMKDFLRRSKGLNRDYWIARIYNYQKKYSHEKI